MALSNDIYDMERDVFTIDTNGNRAKNVVIAGGEISGTLTVAAVGDNKDLTVTTISNGDGWIQILNNLTNQISVAIQNQSTANTLIFSYADNGAGSEGWKIYPRGHKIMLIKAGVTFYVKAEAGTITFAVDRLGE